MERDGSICAYQPFVPATILGTFLLFLLLAAAVSLMPLNAAVLPEGAELEIRLLHGVGTHVSQVGDTVEATVIAPLADQGAVLVPVGTIVSGIIEHKDRLGLGLRHTAARLDFHFTHLHLPEGEIALIDAHVVALETARETVRAPGAVIGIHPTASVSTGVSFVFTLFFFGEPEFRVPVMAFKLLAARSPDAEITFPAGTEMRLRLTQNVELQESTKNTGEVPPLAATEVADVQRILAGLPEQQASRGDNHPSDLVNIMIVGSREEVEQTFRAAGWHGAEHHGLMAGYRIYHSLVQQMGYAMGPMSSLKLGGRLQDISYQKSLDTFAKRHHIRLWQDPTSGAWLGAATEDVGYTFHQMHLSHRTDHSIDNERAKVVNDLAYTGCVAKGALVPRTLKPAEETGTAIVTDGDIAVLRLNSCREVSGMPSDPQKPIHVRAVRAAVAIGEDMVRSNPVTVGVGMIKSMVERTRLQTSERMEASRTYIRPIALSSVGVKPDNRILALR